MDHFKLSPRRSLYRWLGWFFFINSCIALFIIFGYLPQIETLNMVPGATTGSTVFAYIYFIFTFFAEVSLYMFLCAALCLVVATIFPWRALVILLAAILSAIILFSLIGDTIAFRLFHMHYALVGWKVYKAGAFSEVIPLGLKEEFIALSAISVVVVLEIILALWLWRIFSKPQHKLANKIVSASVVGIWLLVYTSFGFAVSDHVWTGGYRYAILRTGRVVPYLSQLYLAAFERKNSVQMLTLGKTKTPMAINSIQKPLRYPLQPIVCSPKPKKMNVVIIAVDTWRYTSMTKKVTPNIYRFAKNSIQFQDHYSGGNCTGPGLFSMFYGLPPNYWDSFLKYKQSPLMLDTFQKEGYQIRAFLSAQSNFPQFDKTIFVNVKSLKRYTPGDSSLVRDQGITKEFVSFINKRNSEKPFFSFMFYDALHNYCEPDRPKQNPFQPAVEHCDRFSLDANSEVAPYLNLYNNKVYFVDLEVAKVLKALKQKNLLKNTIVIITADHGEQMNDEGLGLWGHASAYSTYQLHVPMIVHWPGKKVINIAHQTTHYDIVPTLMNQVLGCSTTASAYSVGQSLFDTKQSPYFIAASYGDYAIISPEKVLRIYPGGDFKITNMYGHPESQSQFNPSVLAEAYRDLQTYFH